MSRQGYASDAEAPHFNSPVENQLGKVLAHFQLVQAAVADMVV
jgi:hypothetical protein